MSAVRYDLDADEKNLVEGFEAAIRKTVELEEQLAELTKKVGTLEAANKKLGDSAKKGGVELGKLAQGAGAASPALGNLLRNADDLMSSFDELVTKVGPAGLAGALAVGFVAAVGAGSAALIALGSAAGEAGERLDKAGLLTLEQSLAAEALRDANEATAVATDLLTLKMGLAFPATEQLTTAWTGLKIAIGEAADEFARWGENIDARQISEASGGLIALGENADRTWASFFLGQKTYQLLTEKAEEFTEAIEEQGEVMARVYGPTPDQLDLVKEAHDDAAAAAKKRTADEKAAATAAAAALKTQAADGAKFTKERNAEQARWKAQKLADDKEMLAAEESARKARAAAQAEADAAEVAAQKKKQEQLKAGIQDGVTGTLQALADIAAAQAQANLAYLDSELDKSETREEAWREQLAQGKDLTQAQRDEISANIKAEEDRQKRIQAERVKAANAAKRAAIGQALIGAAQAIIQCFAQLGPIGGAIAAVPTGIATAAQVAAISKQKFHDGGELGQGPDEFSFGGGDTGRAGETAFAFNQRATEQGAAEVAKDINRRGVQRSANREGMVVLDGRVVGDIVVRERRRPGSPLAVGTDGVRNPFRGR